MTETIIQPNGRVPIVGNGGRLTPYGLRLLNALYLRTGGAVDGVGPAKQNTFAAPVAVYGVSAPDMCPVGGGGGGKVDMEPI